MNTGNGRSPHTAALTEARERLEAAAKWLAHAEDGDCSVASAVEAATQLVARAGEWLGAA